jgi:UMF1 family MFS transporter
MQGVLQVFATVRQVQRYRNVFHFLIARMLYNDAMVSLSVFGGIYAVGIFGWTALDLTLYGVILAVFSIAGGFFGGWLDDKLGSKPTIIISLVLVMLGMVIAISITPERYFFFFPVDPATAKVWELPFFQTKAQLLYLAAVIVITVFVASTHGSNRTLLARIAPPAKMAEFFGLYAMSGTVTAFLAPGLIAIVTTAFESQRIGFASLLVLLIAGFVLLLFVPAKRMPHI